MASTTNSECNTRNCSYYIDKSTLRLYRGKFLASTICLIVLVSAIFVLLGISYNTSQQQIINSHDRCSQELLKAVKGNKNDSISDLEFRNRICTLVEINNEQSKSLLEMQYNKLQSDFTVLSLWAGILMIVFLIFSIYSMFKTDEMIKQGREGLRSINRNSEEVNKKTIEISNKVDEAIKSVESKAEEERKKLISNNQEELEKIRKVIDTTQASFSELVKQKSDEFNSAYESYMVQLRKNEESRSKLLDTLISELANRDSGTKQDKI